MPMDCNKLFKGSMCDIFRNEIISHSIRILRRHGLSDEQIKDELMRDFSLKAEVLDKMLKE